MAQPSHATALGPASPRDTQPLVSPAWRKPNPSPAAAPVPTCGWSSHRRAEAPTFGRGVSSKGHPREENHVRTPGSFIAPRTPSCGRNETQQGPAGLRPEPSRTSRRFRGSRLAGAAWQAGECGARQAVRCAIGCRCVRFLGGKGAETMVKGKEKHSSPITLPGACCGLQPWVLSSLARMNPVCHF